MKVYRNPISWLKIGSRFSFNLSVNIYKVIDIDSQFIVAQNIKKERVLIDLQLPLFVYIL